MVLFPNCKINLGLNIVNKRNDGYHEIETVFYPVELKDAVEAVLCIDTELNTDIVFNSTGLEISGAESNNLCVKAYRLLKNDYPSMSPIFMHLHKVIPMGAGLGGGSADGACMLQLLNSLFDLNLSNLTLNKYALQLGSDCPFFLLNKPCFATGRGEHLQEINLNLSDYTIFLVYPDIHISTALAFSKIKPCAPKRSIQEIIQEPVTLWKGELWNDFEYGVLQTYPELALLKEQLYAQGAVYASMTGSGSTFYGLFKKETDTRLTFPAGISVHQTS